MVNRRLLKVSDSVVDYTQVDVGKEFSSDISNFFMFSVEINSIFEKTRVKSLPFSYSLHHSSYKQELLHAHHR